MIRNEQTKLSFFGLEFVVIVIEMLPPNLQNLFYFRDLFITLNTCFARYRSDMH